MKNRSHTMFRTAVSILFVVLCGGLFVSALDVPVQEVQENTLMTLQATGLLLVLAFVSHMALGPVVRFNATDLCGALLLLWLVVLRSVGSGTSVRYDEVLQAVFLYAALRIFWSAHRRSALLLMTLLFLLGTYEAWVGIRQAYGLTCSNHGLFRVTGTFFNPGPYAGFLAPVFVGAVACAVRRHPLVCRVFRSRRNIRSCRPGVWLWGVVPYVAAWCAILSISVILPATMSRAALAAVAVGCLTFCLCRSGWLRRAGRSFVEHPLRSSAVSVALLLLVAGVVAGAYFMKQDSADGRLLMWKIDTRIMLHHPLYGVGLGAFAGAYGEEQAAYFAAGGRSDAEIHVAGCPESGFNEFLQFGAETGMPGFAGLLLMVTTAIVSAIRRSSPYGYALFAAVVFACFSYPWSVLPLRILFVVLLAGAVSVRMGRTKRGVCWQGYVVVSMAILCGALLLPDACNRCSARIEARRQWSDTRIWMQSERYDYLAEDGAALMPVMKEDFRFLYDYGYALHKEGDSRRSNEILCLGARLSSDPMFWNIIGKNCETLGDDAGAERAYLRAHWMVPNRIYPLYLLAQLYAHTARPADACAVARKALSRPPKVESVQTRRMSKKLRTLLRHDGVPDDKNREQCDALSNF